MKAKKRRKLKAKLKGLKKAYRQARRERKQMEKALTRAAKQEAVTRAAYESLHLQLKPPESPSTASPDDPLATDNLREIPGLGARFEQLLHQAGVTTFAQLVALQPEEWRTIFAQAGTRYRRFDPSPWQEEAARLMEA